MNENIVQSWGWFADPKSFGNTYELPSILLLAFFAPSQNNHHSITIIICSL